MILSSPSSLLEEKRQSNPQGPENTRLTHGIMLVLITTLLSLAGRRQRECEHVKNTKGDQVCREALESALTVEPTRSGEPVWHVERCPARDQ